MAGIHSHARRRRAPGPHARLRHERRTRSAPGASVFNFYSLEVVQRIGYDSFTPDNGVLIAKNKNGEENSCGYGCFTWVIDAHPEDINMVDYAKPDGTPVMRTVADYRQLNDALFHAGLNSGSRYEWEDTPNRLHFYVVDLQRDAEGILSYTVGVKSLDGAGPQKRGVSLKAPAGLKIAKPYGDGAFVLTNTGAPAAKAAALHPQDASAFLDSDIYRLSVSIEGKGWAVDLKNALAAVKFGESAEIPGLCLAHDRGRGDGDGDAQGRLGKRSLEVGDGDASGRLGQGAFESGSGRRPHGGDFRRPFGKIAGTFSAVLSISVRAASGRCFRTAVSGRRNRSSD